MKGFKKGGGLGHMFHPLYFEYIYQFNVLVGFRSVAGGGAAAVRPRIALTCPDLPWGLS